ncbi:MAG: hypothetical protein LBL90_06715 [Prevotellaceae bacterium]|jgi:hypothetical protein|nr:hypothetical protein [Prevotellaceae bacterium]
MIVTSDGMPVEFTFTSAGTHGIDELGQLSANLSQERKYRNHLPKSERFHPSQGYKLNQLRVLLFST